MSISKIKYPRKLGSEPYVIYHVIAFVPSLDFIQMPTFVLFKKGEKVSDLVGARPQDLQVCQSMIFNPLCAELSLCSDPGSKSTYPMNNCNLCWHSGANRYLNFDSSYHACNRFSIDAREQAWTVQLIIFCSPGRLIRRKIWMNDVRNFQSISWYSVHVGKRPRQRSDAYAFVVSVPLGASSSYICG